MRQAVLCRLALSGLALALAMAVAASVGATRQERTRSGETFVFGVDVDPLLLDPALAFDFESARVANQVFEGLVDVAPGQTRVVPRLATHWKPSRDGKAWTFFLRRGVKFTDGTPLTAAAVCFNFQRWDGFAGSLQSAARWWNLVFGGFRNPAPPLAPQATGFYRGCNALSKLSVRLRLSRPTTSFLAALALPFFGIASPTALRRYDADAGEADENGLFHPSGTYALAHPTGTGPFMFSSWRHGRRVVLVRNPRYWGHKARVDRLIFRTIADGTTRLRALERGTIHGLDATLTAAIPAIRRNPRLKLVDVPSGNVGWVGINQAIPPMNKLRVRQALAYGLDRAAVVRSFYEGRGHVADQFLPAVYVGHARRVQRYRYDPARSKALLRKAGLRLPVRIDFWYPTDTWRPYMHDPKSNFDVFAAGLARAGFKVVAHGAPWETGYLETMFSGKAQLYLSGWIGDTPDPQNFFDLFRSYKQMLGFKNAKLFALVGRADAETNLARRARMYELASRMVMKLLPLVPYVNFRFAEAVRKNVTGLVTDSMGPLNESFANVRFSR